MHDATEKQLTYLQALQKLPERQSAGTTLTKPCYHYYYYYKRQWCYLGVAVQTASRTHMHISRQEAESDTLGGCNLLASLNQHLALLHTCTDECIGLQGMQSPKRKHVNHAQTCVFAKVFNGKQCRSSSLTGFHSYAVIAVHCQLSIKQLKPDVA